MIDHLSFKVSNVEKSKAFYDAVLAVFGYDEGFSNENFAMYKHPQDKSIVGFQVGEVSSLHFAFRGEKKQVIDDFYKAAIAAGGKDNGAPGIRENYGPDYYAAFVFDPDGNNIEAVTHSSE